MPPVDENPCLNPPSATARLVDDSVLVDRDVIRIAVVVAGLLPDQLGRLLGQNGLLVLGLLIDLAGRVDERVHRRPRIVVVPATFLLIIGLETSDHLHELLGVHASSCLVVS